VIHHFVLDVSPGSLAINRAYRAHKAGRRIYVKKSDEYKHTVLAVANYLRGEWGDSPQLKGSVSVTLVSNWTRQNQKGHLKDIPWGDIDAFIKGVLDALEQSGIVENDTQCTHLEVFKNVADSPSIELFIEKRENFYSDNDTALTQLKARASKEGS